MEVVFHALKVGWGGVRWVSGVVWCGVGGQTNYFVTPNFLLG